MHQHRLSGTLPLGFNEQVKRLIRAARRSLTTPLVRHLGGVSLGTAVGQPPAERASRWVSEAKYAVGQSVRMETPSRRQVVTAAATGTAISLAGCSALDDEDDATVGDTSDGDARVTIAVDIEERLADRQAAIQQQVDDEELSQEEAQAELQTAQVEALEAAVAAVESYAADDAALSVVDSSARAGALLVAGAPAALIETLATPDVAGLVSAAQFEQIQE